MSRHSFDLPGNRKLMVGSDRLSNTLFLQLWDASFNSDFNWGAPAKAAGYAEWERVHPLAGEYGPFPLRNMHDVDRVLVEWGIDDEIREKVGAAFAQDDLAGVGI